MYSLLIGAGNTTDQFTTKLQTYSPMKMQAYNFQFWKGLILTISSFLLTTFAYTQETYADTLNCEGGTPTFVVDLSADSDSLWTSLPAERAGSCCGTDDNCVQFSLTLAADAVGIIFSVPDGCGAAPSGSLFYQVDCGPLTSVGEPLCLDGPGPFTITFCKPGANENCYSIQSVSAPEASESITITDACLDSLWISGVDEETVSWMSIFPGEAGEYDGLLDCTSGCDTTIVEGEIGVIYPELIKYEVCGMSIGGCSGTPYCDTVDVSIVPSLAVEITPLEPTICFGEAGIDLTATPTGGAEPYTYLWSTGETTAGIFAGGPGTYFVEISDGTGCALAYDTVVVTEYLVPITADAGPDITICADPSPTVNLNGAITGSTTAVWSNGLGAFTADDTDLDAIYTPTAAEIAAGSIDLILTTTDNGSCPGAEDTLTIFFPTFTTAVAADVQDIDCFGNDNGLVDVSPTGGALPLIYAWDTGAATEDITDLSPGDYTLTVTDTNGCQESFFYTITEPAPLLANAALTNATCFGFDDGAIDWTITGGTTGYTFEWATGELTEDLAGIGAGSYDFTVTDANGCTFDSTVIITEPTALVVLSAPTFVSCNGLSDGAIDITVFGGVPGYTYGWSGGETTEDIAGLATGTYSVDVTDLNGCVTEIDVFIEEPLPLVSDEAITDVLCFGEASGAIDLTVSGGTPAYTFSWDSGEVTEDLTDVLTGSYTVTITDANGCELDRTFAVAEPLPIDVTIDGTDVTCIGYADGTADMTVTGGVAPYSYAWEIGGGIVGDEDITGLSSGTYTVEITDGNGCEANDSIAIAEPIDFEAGPDATTEVCTNGGLVNLNDFLMATTVGVWAETTTSGQFNTLTGVFNTDDLVAGDYIFTYTIPVFTPCTDTVAEFTITVHPLPEVSLTADEVVGCAPMAVAFTNTSPDAGGECTWFFGDGSIFEGCGPVSHSYEFPGDYDVRLEVTSAFGCTNTFEADNFIHIHEGPDAAFYYSPDDPTIENTLVDFDNYSVGATAYSWNFGDGSPESNLENPTHVFPDAPNETYTISLIAINDYGCTDTATQKITVDDVLIYYVPNVFTPDGNSFNDDFKPVMTSGYDVYDYHLTIFNRWGEVVFESRNADIGWDGTYGQGDLVQDGVYVWKLDFAETMSDKTHHKHGHVTVLK